MSQFKKENILVIGAGAIGRGYLPWILDESRYGLFYVDSNVAIIEQIRKNGGFSTYRVNGKKLEKRQVKVLGAYTPSEYSLLQAQDLAAVFINVGPRNVVSAAKLVENSHCAIILSENDPQTVNVVKEATELRNVFFAVPDVIASNTAPDELLQEDPLSIITENGELFIDEGVGNLYADFRSCTPAELKTQWTAKLYLHNTPHCIAAYLGALSGVTYVHEAMMIPRIRQIVCGAMTEMLNSLKLKWEIPHGFLDWYAEKEIARFSNPLLSDPISRVAREPLRKLELEGRLIGAAQICLSLGFIPENILIGIGSALLFDNEKDADHHLSFMRRALSPEAFLSHVLSLRSGEALECVLRERLSGIFENLDKLSAETKRTAK